MRLHKHKTNRGFKRIDFTDRYNRACSIQESSAAEDFYLWFGMDQEPPEHLGQRLGARMHLKRGDVKKLIKVLQHFVDTGQLP